jgi:dienelactone hydrolase
MHAFTIYLTLLAGLLSQRTETVRFPSVDGVSITADWYRAGENPHVIILFHQAGYSRGEYLETAPELVKLGFTCLAVDLRAGDESNGIRNETAEAARKAGKRTDLLDAERDMIAALEYVRQAYPASRITLFGSSYSASLALKIARNHSDAYAVIAFSPGEYFGKDLNMRNSLAGFVKPAFVTGSRKEYPEISYLFNYAQGSFITVYSPSSEGVHGSRALWKDSPGNPEYWEALKKFLVRIR